MRCVLPVSEGLERIVGVATWRHGALEARCRRADVEARMHGALELWRLVADLGTWRYGALEACCTRADVEVWSSGVTELSGRLSPAPPQATLEII